MSSSRRMDHMTWPEIEASKSKPVIVPIGSTEQHSQHLPLGVDAMIASHVSEDLAERIDGIVAPTMNYGYKSKPLSGGGPLFPGTIDMNGVTVINQMHDVLGELIAILGGSLFMQQKAFPNVGVATVYGLGSGIGWLLAIVGMAAIREKLSYSNVPNALKGLGITFIITGLMGMAFMCFSGLKI